MHPVSGAPDSDPRTEHHTPRAAQVSHSHHVIASILRTYLLPDHLTTSVDTEVAILFAHSLVRCEPQKWLTFGKGAAASLSMVLICTRSPAISLRPTLSPPRDHVHYDGSASADGS